MRGAAYENPSLPQRSELTFLALRFPVGLTDSLSSHRDVETRTRLLPS